MKKENLKLSDFNIKVKATNIRNVYEGLITNKKTNTKFGVMIQSMVKPSDAALLNLYQNDPSKFFIELQAITNTTPDTIKPVLLHSQSQKVPAALTNGMNDDHIKETKIK